MTVPLRSRLLGVTLAGNGFSLAGLLVRESHENGIVSFLPAGVGLDGGGVGDVLIGRGGGGPHGIEGNEPERPDREEDLGAAGDGSLPILLFDAIVVDRDLSGCELSFSPSCTSSSDVADIRLAVSSGDFSTMVVPSLSTLTPNIWLLLPPSDLVFKSIALESGDCSTCATVFEIREVWTETEDNGRSVNDRTDCGRDDVSGASWKFSYSSSQRQSPVGLNQAYGIVFGACGTRKRSALRHFNLQKGKTS